MILKNIGLEDLEKSIKLYNSALSNEVGETDPMTWLELGYAYSFRKESENALRAFERADQYSLKGTTVNYKIKNQALHNIALIHTSNKNFDLAYPQIKEVIDSKQDYDSSSLILKGINEVLLGHENEGIKQIKIGLNESPELIKDIYFYVEEGILSSEFCQRFIDLLLEEKTSEISTIHNNYQTIRNDLISIWEKYPTNKFNNIIERSHSLFEDFKKSSEHGFISVHGIKSELQKLFESLKDELQDILKGQIENQKLQIEEDKQSLHNIKHEIQTQEQKYERMLKSINESRSGCFLLIGLILFGIGNILVEKFYKEYLWLLLVYIPLVIGLFYVFGGGLADDKDKKVREQLRSFLERARKDKEQIQNRLNEKVQYLSKLNSYCNKI